MNQPILRPLRDPAFANLFWTLCEFSATDVDAETPDWFRLQSGRPLEVIGRNACGGYYCLSRGQADCEVWLLYVGSEGGAGVIAKSLSQGLQVMIALPYWKDCLKFSGAGKLEEMRKAQTVLEAKLRERQPDLDVCREECYAHFGLAAPGTPVDILHQAVMESARLPVVAAADGSRFEDLFNTFVIEDAVRSGEI